MQLKDKVIVVSGGSGLLGKEMVGHLKSQGAQVVNFDLAEETDISAGHVKCDVTDDQSVRQSFAKVIEHFGRLDGLVNNAYPRTADWGTPFEKIDPDSWRKNVDWQLNSYFVCCQVAIGQMVKQGSGSIVNIASIYGVVGNDFSIYRDANMEPPAAYSAIKGGLINFSRFLASKYGRQGIRINCISPGGIFDGQPAAFVSAYEDKVPMGRMGHPEDISGPVSFLLSDQSQYITGHNLLVDGGWTII